MSIIRLSDGSELALRSVRPEDPEPVPGSNTEGVDVVPGEGAAPSPEEDEHDQPRPTTTGD